MTHGILALTLTGITGALVALSAATTTFPTTTRDAQVCGVEFQNGSYHFARGEGEDGRVTIERVPADGERDTVVMRFDAPTDFVDFLARGGQAGDGRMQAEVVAYDAYGRVVDTDVDHARPGEFTTLQVVAETEGELDGIRELHLQFQGAAAAPIELLDLDFGQPAPCPLAS